MPGSTGNHQRLGSVWRELTMVEWYNEYIAPASTLVHNDSSRAVYTEPASIQSNPMEHKMATGPDKLNQFEARSMSPSVRRAVDTVRAGGENVSDEAIQILERVERREIDSEEAVRLIIQLNSGN